MRRPHASSKFHHAAASHEQAADHYRKAARYRDCGGYRDADTVANSAHTRARTGAEQAQVARQHLGD